MSPITETIELNFETKEQQERFHARLSGESGGQQIVARIKKGSKYWGQTAPNEWFDARVVDDASYRIRGNDNNYRLGDVALGVRLSDGSVVDLSNGKKSS